MTSDAPTSKRLLRGITEGDVLEVVERISGTAFFAVDADRNVIAFGPGMEEITGLAADQVLGRHCLNAFRCANCLQTCGVFEQGAIGPVEMDIFRDDGRTIRVVKTAQTLTDEDGAIVGALEQIRALNGPAASSALTAVEPARVVDGFLYLLGRYFVSVDREMRVLHASERLASVVGLSGDELAGSQVSDLLGDDLLAPGSELRAALERGERREGWRARLHVGAGAQEAVSISAAPIPNDMTLAGNTCWGEASYIIVIRRDETVGAAPPEAPDRFGGMVARSPAMHAIFRLIALLRDNTARVLITGESGTGKELVAQAIHAHSLRAAKPMVVVNCAALPGELLESELFGHVRGAFTGAVRDKVGRFELADGGTIFLDEIGDLPLPLQVKLLRVLEEGTFEPVGDSQTRRVDVRVISATHVDLALAVREKRFREDLYYRLRVVPIEIPPLRQRREDLEVLVAHLLERIGKRRGRALRLSPAAMRSLLAHDWPGNVRELENALEYATAVCEGQTIHESDLPAEVNAPEATSTAKDIARPAAQQPLKAREGQTEADRIRDALEACQYKRQAAADRLGMSRWTLWRKMKEYHLD